MGAAGSILLHYRLRKRLVGLSANNSRQAMKSDKMRHNQIRGTTSDVPYDRWIFWCEASSCRFSGSPESRMALVEALRTQGTTNVAVVRSGCLGLCGAGPSAVTYPEGAVYLHAGQEHAVRLAASLADDKPDKVLAVKAPAWYREQLVARLGRVVERLIHRFRTGETLH